MLPIPPQTPKVTGPFIYRFGNGEHLEWLEYLMLRHELYIPAATALNDLRDARPRLHRHTEADWLAFMKSLSPVGVPPVSREEHERRLEDAASSLGIERMLDLATERYHQMMTRYRIYSMSKRWDNLSMWHWYASKHHGYCLEFRNAPNFGDVREVVYDSAYTLDLTDMGHATPNWFFYKSPDWSNEEEMRLVLPRKVGGPLLRFNPAILNRVLLGKDMSAANVAQVIELGARRTPPVQVVTTRWDPIHLHLVIVPSTETPRGTAPPSES